MTAATVPTRQLPRLGGFSLTVLGLELRRMMRNKRAVVFTLIMPGVLYLAFGNSGTFRTQELRNGLGNVSAVVMVSMAVYGAMIACTTGGATVSVERAAGWSRQLRLTPLNPGAYVAMKILLAMINGGASVAVVFAVALLTGARIDAVTAVECGLLAWICGLVFASFGLFVGYLLPSENLMQILGFALMLLSFAGGLFIPLEQMGHVMGTIAQFTPVYGVSTIARYPLIHEGSLFVAVGNVLAWTAIFAGGAIWRFRRDTARV
jgi:ABC-2 type transport system permease protein